MDSAVECNLIHELADCTQSAHCDWIEDEFWGLCFERGAEVPCHYFSDDDSCRCVHSQVCEQYRCR